MQQLATLYSYNLQLIKYYLKNVEQAAMVLSR